MRCSEQNSSCSIDGVSYGGVICMLWDCHCRMQVAKSAWMSNQQCITERMESHAQSSCLPFVYYHGVRCQCQVRMSVHSNRNYEHNNQNGFTRYTAFNETEMSFFRWNDKKSALRRRRGLEDINRQPNGLVAASRYSISGGNATDCSTVLSFAILQDSLCSSSKSGRSV